MADTELVVALQEWAAVCAALATGDIILTVRKGGILDKGGFRPEHRRCLLWPSREHQDSSRLRPPWSAAAIPAVPAVATTWAELAEVWWLDREAQLAAVNPDMVVSYVNMHGTRGPRAACRHGLNGRPARGARCWRH